VPESCNTRALKKQIRYARELILALVLLMLWLLPLQLASVRDHHRLTATTQLEQFLIVDTFIMDLMRFMTSKASDSLVSGL